MQDLNANDFFKTIEKGYYLVDFFANWCGPCKMLSPNIDEAEKEFSGEVNFAKLNVDDAAMLCDRFGINTIPNVILFRDGEIVDRFVGLRSASSIISFVRSNLG